MSWRNRWGVVGVGLSTMAVVALVGPPAHAGSAGPTTECQLPHFGPGASYRPQVDPRDFGPQVTNPLFPLRVGVTYEYAGVKDGARALDIVVASRHTRTVYGVVTRIVEDRLYLDGLLAERTSDYYAQDRCGNVWYFGEDTAELDEHGHVVSTEGSFHAGVKGAQPGVIMQAHPQLGRTFRQEWFAGQAEDVFQAVDRSAPVTVPYGAFTGALRTKEWTALEPGVVDAKYYVRGIGEVFEGSTSGPTERLQLLEILS